MCHRDVEQVKFVEKVPYTQLLGGLVYIVTIKRPGIFQAGRLVSIYQYKPSKVLSQVVKQIL